jgi:hypothetical protein
MSFIIVSKVILVIVLHLFLPLTALTYYVFRRRRRRYEADTAAPASGGVMLSNIWPPLAFPIGTFLQRGLRWLTDRVPMVGPETEASVRRAPLALVEGIELHDSLRLEELGIDTCYDLTTADVVPLILQNAIQRTAVD